MRSVARVVAVATLGVAALAAVTAVWSLGTDRWISTSYGSRPARAYAKVWAPSPLVVGTEAEWLAATSPSRVIPATVPATTRIDLGALDVIDVRPLPAGLNLGPADTGSSSETGGAKMLVSAREPRTGRMVQFIVDAAGIDKAGPLPAAPIGKHNGL